MKMKTRSREDKTSILEREERDVEAVAHTPDRHCGKQNLCRDQGSQAVRSIGSEWDLVSDNS